MKICDASKRVIKIVTIISNMENLTIEEAFDVFLNYYAINLHIDTKTSVALKKETLEVINKLFDLNFFKDSNCDFVGKACCSLKLCRRYKMSLDIDELFRLYDRGDFFPGSAFVTSLYTGGSLIGKPNVFLFYTTHKNLMLYKIALINIKLFNLPMFSLYISKENPKNFDLVPSSTNWLHCNKWDPVKTSYLV